MKPVNRLMARVLKKRLVSVSFALLLCTLAYAYWSVSGSRATSSYAAGIPVQIGNRVWLDSNRNGYQNTGEPGISGVTVDLYSSKGQLITTAITDANGQYHFTVSPDANYVIKLDKAADYISGPLKGDQLTVMKKDCEHVTDSKAELPNDSKAIGEGNYPQLVVEHLASEKNVNSFNVGFTQGSSKAGQADQESNSPWSHRCRPFPPEDKSTPEATPPTDASTLTPTPIAKETPTSGPKKPTATPGPKPPTQPTTVPTGSLPTEFPTLPETGSDSAGHPLP